MLAFAAASLALVASAHAAPIAASLATVEASLSTPNTIQTDGVEYYLQNGNAGACGLYSEDSDLVAGLPTEFYSELGAVSAYCGSYIVIKSEANNKSVTARVADASATNRSLSVSIATWQALNGTATHLDTVQWRFANETETAAAKKALGSSSSAVSSPVAEKTPSSAPAPSSTSEYVAPSTTSTSEYVAPSTTSTSEYVAPSSTQAPTTTAAPQTTTEAPQTTTQAPSDTYDYASASSASKASADAAWASSSSAAAAASKASADAAWAPSSSAAQAQATAESNSYSTSSASSGSYSGTATYFYQGGNPGHCGTVHSDSDSIVALTSSMYGSGDHCGQTVSICSTDSGKCTSATVADSCPSCTSSGDLDLSVAAFTALADTSAGVTSITWSFA